MTAPSANRRRAFTLIELLVVIAVISILVGIVLPAVQNVREAARRMKCGSNLKQIGLAVQQYEQSRRRLPPTRPAADQSLSWASWAWLLLPYLERETLYRTYADGSSEPNSIAVAIVPAYYCPLRRPPAEFFATKAGSIKQIGGDYAGCIGTTGADEPYAGFGEPIRPNGAFVAFQGIRMAEILDGASNTLLVGEEHHTIAGGWDGGHFDGQFPAFNTRCAGPGFPLAASRIDPGWKFGSYHPGICQFVFADGSVRSIRNNVSEAILGLLAQRNDRQAIPSYD